MSIWKSVRIGDIFHVTSGGTPSRSNPEYYKGGTIPWIKTGDLKDKYVNQPDEYITAEALKNSSAKIFPKDTVLIAMYGATIGACSILQFEATTNQACGALLPSKQCDVTYLYYFIKSIKNDLINKGVGGAQPNISGSIIKEIKIPLPPLATQQKIAAILDAADELRQKDKALIAKYDELTQALFLDMFGDPVSNPKGWDIKTIEDITKNNKGSIKRGPFGGALKKEIFVEKGYLVYEQFHALNNDFTMARYFIDKDKFNELKGFEVKPGDIIISCSGIYLGKLAIIPKDAKEGIINQALLKISLNEQKMRNEFFVFHFTQKNFKEKYFDADRGAGIPNFPPMPVFKKFPFISPPIVLQNQFVERVNAIEVQKALAQSSALKSEELFNSLLQKAFNGGLVC